MKVLFSGNISCDLISSPHAAKGELFSTSARPGGSILNAAVLASRLGVKCSLLTKTGTDFISDMLVDFLREEKVNCSNISRDKDLKPGLAFARIDPEGESSYVFYNPPGRAAAFEKNALSANMLKEHSALHTSSMHSYSDHTFDNVLYLMKKARKHGIVISYDPNWRAKRVENIKKARSRIFVLMKMADLVKLSMDDLLGITGESEEKKALTRLPKNAFVTMGAAGAYFYDKAGDKKTHVAAYPVEVIDTIGAGDGFTAGILCQLAKKGLKGLLDNVEQTMRFAQAVSAIVCEGSGATETLKSEMQVNEFLER